MFGKAKIKRFNDEVGFAPAPNAYDAKIPVSKKSGIAVSTSKRFDEKKNETPGPGQYLTVPDASVRASPRMLQRSASFRVNSLTKSGSRHDLSSRNDLFKTPVSTPRRLRRSISQGDVTVSQSPRLKPEDLEDDKGQESQEEEITRLRSKVNELEQQLNDAMEKLLVSEDSVVVHSGDKETETELRTKLEQLEAELETCKAELRLRDEDLEKSEKLAEELDSLKLQCDYAYTLKSENELLSQDIQTLEEQLTKSKDERDTIESELEEMRKIRKDLDAKNVFLHFTQEQLNAQVVSLESVVKNLKTENHLLNKGIKNLVEQVQVEKKKYDELSEQYNSENAEAEVEFKNLQLEMEENKIKSKNLEIELRAKLGEAEFDKCELVKSLEDLKKDLEVSENDKTALKDQFEITEKSFNEISLDLAEVSKHKQELAKENEVKTAEIATLNAKLTDTEKNLEEVKNERDEVKSSSESQLNEIDKLQKDYKELENDMKEIEMSKTGLEGANAALEEEVLQLENNLNEVKKSLEDVESAKEKLTEDLSELKITKQEVEESLLDTQGLVEDMEIRMMEAHNKHKEEATELSDNLRKVTSALDNIKDERASLLEMNTSLSTQVAEALHTIHNLQMREDSLGQELGLVKQFMEAAQAECEEDRMRMMQAEDEILTLQAEMEDAFIRAEQAEAKVQSMGTEAERSRAHIHQLMAEMSGAKEDHKAELSTLKAAYNSSVTELSESKNVGRQLLDRMAALEDELDGKKKENSRILKDFEERNEEALNEMDKMVDTFEQEKSLFSDKIKHLEGLRDNLEKTLSEKTELLTTQKEIIEESRQKMEFSINKIEEVTKTNLRLKGNLELRATENLKLKDQIETIKKEAADLQARTEADQAKMKELSEQKADIDRLRTAELEMCIKLRDKLAKAEKEAEAGESAVRSMEAQQVVVMEAEAKLEEEKIKGEELLAVVRKYKERMEEMESLMSQMDERNEELEEKAAQASDQLKVLQDMVEPFKEQLEGYEMEKNALLSSQAATKDEVSKLSKQYSSLLGHQNHNQKIKHVVQLKQENVTLKSRVEALQLDLSKAQKAASKWEQRCNEATGLKKFDPRLSFAPTPRNKENFQTPVVNVKESRKSTGSPLARVNRS